MTPDSFTSPSPMPAGWIRTTAPKKTNSAAAPIPARASGHQSCCHHADPARATPNTG
jgi:hypothetical protein